MIFIFCHTVVSVLKMAKAIDSTNVLSYYLRHSQETAVEDTLKRWKEIQLWSRPFLEMIKAKR